MLSARRIGRTEEQQTFLQNVTRKKSGNFGIFMGMLMREPSNRNPVNNMRQRKQGTTVRHPLDLIDTNIQRSPVGIGESVSSIADMEKGYTRKSSWFALRRSGSIASSVASRKSSTRSIRSTTTITSTRSTGSYIRRNTGTFDGGNSRQRKKNTQRRPSASSQKDKIISDFYKELEQLQEMSSSSSSSEDEEEDENKNKKTKQKIKKKKVEKVEADDEANKRRIEEYVKQHSVYDHTKNDNIDDDEGFIPATPTPDRSYENKLRESQPVKKIESTKLNLRNTNKMERGVKTVLNHNKYTCHADVTAKKLNNMFFHTNGGNVPNKFDNLPKTRIRRTQSAPSKPRNYNAVTCNIKHYQKDSYHKVSTKESPEDFEKAMSESSCSTDSAHGSTRSISSMSSCSTQARGYPLHLPTVPHSSSRTNPTGRPKNKSLPVSLNYIRRTSLCFRGVTCQVYHNASRVNKALTHAGCIGLAVPGASAHKCQH